MNALKALGVLGDPTRRAIFERIARRPSAVGDLAAGLPVIASPVGENCNVINSGVNGFLADSPDEWADALKKLYRDRELYSKVAAAAKKSSSEYSIQKYFPVFLDFMEKTFSDGKDQAT